MTLHDALKEIKENGITHDNMEAHREGLGDILVNDYDHIVIEDNGDIEYSITAVHDVSDDMYDNSNLIIWNLEEYFEDEEYYFWDWDRECKNS